MTDEAPSQFHGFHRPDSNFFRLPNEWTDITASVTSLAELKVVEYVLKHTWGYSEFGIAKRITTDEFISGRKTRAGERIDKGTGLSNKSVIDGLNRAIEHGFLSVEIDDSDKARIRKSYKLNMREPVEAGGGDGVKNGKPGVKNLHTNTHKLHTSHEDFTHRSEKETQEDIYNNVQNVDKHIKPETNESSKLRTKYESNGRSREEVDYFAQTIADKLGDQKSLTYYKLLCARYDPHQLLQKAAEIVGDGGARKRGAVFAAWVKTLSQGGYSPANTKIFTDGNQESRPWESGTG